jgi:hypothetical protein
MPREAKLWTETLIVMLIIAVMSSLGRFKQKRETFIADNKAKLIMLHRVYFGMVDSYKKILDRPPSEPNCSNNAED